MNRLRLVANERWGALAARERLLIGGAALLVGVALLWLLAIRPAWRTLQSAPADLARLETQWQTMQGQAAEAAALRATPALPAAAAGQALQAATARLGASGRVLLQGERAVLTLQGADADALRQWLVEARSGARARPLEANLSRAGAGFNGTIVLALGGGS